MFLLWSRTQIRIVVLHPQFVSGLVAHFDTPTPFSTVCFWFGSTHRFSYLIQHNMFLVWSHTLGLLSYSTQFVSGSVPHIGTPTSFPSTHLTHQKNPGLSSTQRWAFYSPHLFSTVCFRLGPACRRGRFTVLPSPSQHSVFLVESCMQTWSFYSTSLTQSAPVSYTHLTLPTRRTV